jgi:NDP-sugar pyrophosphorylase family protein
MKGKQIKRKAKNREKEKLKMRQKRERERKRGIGGKMKSIEKRRKSASFQPSRKLRRDSAAQRAATQ